MVHQLTKYAKQVTLSDHKRPNETAEERQKRQKLYGQTVLLKDDVHELIPNGVLYKDGTHQDFDVIIYAIGEFNYMIKIRHLVNSNFRPSTDRLRFGISIFYERGWHSI